MMELVVEKSKTEQERKGPRQKCTLYEARTQKCCGFSDADLEEVRNQMQPKCSLSLSLPPSLPKNVSAQFGLSSQGVSCHTSCQLLSQAHHFKPSVNLLLQQSLRHSLCPKKNIQCWMESLHPSACVTLRPLSVRQSARGRMLSSYDFTRSH